MGNDLEQLIRRIVAEQLDVTAEQVTNEARFIDDLGADSLDIVELVMTIEEEFDIEDIKIDSSEVELEKPVAPPVSTPKPRRIEKVTPREAPEKKELTIIDKIKMVCEKTLRIHSTGNGSC